jgi:antitoxin component of RelBE/YafQ-DinJ toxin-antitoxin module
MIHARTDAGLKAETETILRSLGLSYTEAINLFSTRCGCERGFRLPWRYRIRFYVVFVRGRRRFI